ncbi:MAG: VWA domain-containing protein [Bryobacteraceae bacterium]|nr:VWA domain-containing protein [Bryobacteraceae bacterium]MDW8377214.1 VWA domain-containing protein [Bryobacterales bacterium]
MTSIKEVLVKVLSAIFLGACLLAAQDPQTTIRTQIINIVAPTVVMDKNGMFVNGLTAQDFRLYDNDKLQDIRVDVSFQPIDVVVCIQADAVTQDVLPRIRKIGPLLENLVLGEQGQVAIIAFDHRIRVMQDFTSDGEKIKEALHKITPGSTTAVQIDAVNTGVRMLSRRGKDRRRVLLLISETRDKGSEGKLRDTLLLAELNNVLVYTVNMSRFINTLLAKAQPPRPDPIPPSARPMQGGVPQTPTTMAQLQLGNVLPAFVEIFRSTKAIFVSNPAEVLTKYTGGREFGFVSQRALEEAISKIGEELHSQYLISYNPNNKLEGGWHTIRVEVRNRPGLEIRTRSGYWLAGVPE